MGRKLNAGRLFLAGSVIFAAFAMVIATCGGVSSRVAGMRVSARSWERPAAIAVVLFLVWVVVARRSILAALIRAWDLLARPQIARGIALVATLAALAFALAFGTYAVGGADSYGYVSQAELLARGALTQPLERHRAFDWPNVAATLTPLGYTRRLHGDVMSPIYPPGYPLLMAPLALLHRGAVFLVVPLCAAVCVWLSFVLGRALNDDLTGAIAATLLATSPTFLFQSVQPMSDVPVTAFWLAALVAARIPTPLRATAAGFLASVAIAIRPNLAPLAALPAALILMSSPHARMRRILVFMAAAAPMLLLLAYIQYVRYGSPLASGYGTFGELFSLSNVEPNLNRYPRWMNAAHTPFIWMWLIAPIGIVTHARRDARLLGWAAYALALAVVCAYLPYVYFQRHEWTYTRFLLPGMPAMLCLGAAMVLTVIRQLPLSARTVALVIFVCGIGGYQVFAARREGVAKLREFERAYVEAGRAVENAVPAGAMILAHQHSGSLRYYTGRQTLRWDVLHPDALDRTLMSLRSAGMEPYAVLTESEDREFAARFASADAVRRLHLIAAPANVRVYGFK